MYQTVKKIAAHLMIAVSLMSVPAAAGAQQDENRPQDREIRQTVRFAKGKSSIIIKKQIRRGTSHTYILKARRGQRMQVVLTTRGQTSFTVYSPTEGAIEDADGVKDWVGDLTETGNYEISIGTDNTANYTLEIAIK
ncbi:MAG: hypothetical protein R2747_00480 [Pyrinomonadaceae bacterium]